MSLAEKSKRGAAHTRRPFLMPSPILMPRALILSPPLACPLRKGAG